MDRYSLQASNTKARAGYLSSQFHFRTQMQTFPIDFPPILTEATVEGSVPTAVFPNDPTVLRIAGDVQSHYTFAFDIGDRIIIYDTPVNNRRMQAVLQSVREVFQFVYPQLSAFNQERMALLAREVVDFVGEKGWQVDFAIGTHGFPNEVSTAYEGLLQIANGG